MRKHIIIYIPGIGDHKPYYQPNLISLWKYSGVVPYYHPVIWRSQDENFDQKLDKLSELITKLSRNGDKVSLVGVSAGATAAFNAYMANKYNIHKVVYVCGKLRNPQSIGENYYSRNPSFKESLELVQEQLGLLDEKDAAKMLSLKPIYDQTVPIADTVLPGVRNWRMLSLWHIPSIFIGITVYAPIICGFIKKENKFE